MISRKQTRDALLFAVALGIVAGCSSARSSGVSDTARVPTVPTAEIPRDALEPHGLESLWFFPPSPRENPVLSATLLPSGLFTITQPGADRPGTLRRVERDTGETKWSYELELREPPRSEPTAYQYATSISTRPDELFLVQLDTVFVIDLQWGDLLRKEELPFPVATSVVGGEEFYFTGSDNGRIYGIRKSNHVQEWSYVTDASVTAAPVVSPDSVLVGSTDGKIYRFSPSAGWVRGFSWKFETGAPVVSAPVDYSQWVLAGSADYKLYCLNRRDGTIYWSFLAQAPIEESPVVYSLRPGHDVAFCVAVQRAMNQVQRTLFAVKLADGAKLWRAEGLRRVVSVGKDTVYAISDPESGAGTNLVALDVDSGEERFRLDIANFHYVPTNLANFGRSSTERGRIYLVARDGAIQVLSERF